MKSLLKGHRRTKSAEVSVVTAELPDAAHKLRSSSSFQQMTLAYKNPSNGSSQSLRKLNPMTFLRKASFDSGRRLSSGGSARTAPVLSLDECRDCGVIYGTRTHYWGMGHEGSVIIQEGDDEEEEAYDAASSRNSVDEATTPRSSSPGVESLSSPALSSSSFGQSEPMGSEPTEPETDEQDHEQDPDTASIYSFDDNSGVGRNRSVNYYKTLSLPAYMYASSATAAGSFVSAGSRGSTYTLNDGDIDEDDLSYDNFLDEVNAVPEDFGDRLSFRSASSRSSLVSRVSSRSSGSSSLRRRQSSVLRKKDYVTTLYSPEVIDAIEDEWNQAGGNILTQSLAPISEG